ncbi:uncharacterized protein LOC132067011 [Lycium ferocissimum]|uniref:uncharacterized protein LOC132067011 n=1 Tax=Lycium ferocissimum TaxID=112874 RepID=UPI0028151FD2|nr:uncharacterized protein LOC132067011 [Lycium ferocissimum]
MYVGYNKYSNGPRISHLAYADDVILFTSWDNYSLKKLLKQLRNYEEVTGQKINNGKSMFLTTDHTFEGTHRRITRMTCFQLGSFPFNYLDCPIYTGKEFLILMRFPQKYLEEMMDGKETFYLMEVKLLSFSRFCNHKLCIFWYALSPPKTVLKQIEKYLANFFWGQNEGKNKYHWSHWHNLCYPKEEKGLGFKALKDIQNSFILKRWWRFRIQKSL